MAKKTRAELRGIVIEFSEVLTLWPRFAYNNAHISRRAADRRALQTHRLKHRERMVRGF